MQVNGRKVTLSPVVVGGFVDTSTVSATTCAMQALLIRR
jgi:hypothetical protein